MFFVHGGFHAVFSEYQRHPGAGPAEYLLKTSQTNHENQVNTHRQSIENPPAKPKAIERLATEVHQSTLDHLPFHLHWVRDLEMGAGCLRICWESLGCFEILLCFKFVPQVFFCFFLCGFDMVFYSFFLFK